MDDNTFWARLWQTLIIGATIAIVSIAGCRMQFTEAASKSSDPVAFACATHVSETTMPATCTVLLSRGTAK